MDRIKLTRGKYALVDKEDFEKVNQYTWNCLQIGYAQRNSGDKVYMHRFVLGAKKGEGVDHINGDRLDNRKSNLRICPQIDNARNSLIKSSNTSGYKGVSWAKRERKWIAYITVNYKHIWGGGFDDKVLAAQRYNELAIQYFGEFAKLNKI